MKTMTFAEFSELFRASFNVIAENSDRLYEVNADKDYLWNLYLDSFPADANRVFRKRREFDCSCCRHFIRQFGNVVGIIDGKMVSVWDFKTDSAVYQPVVDALSEYIHMCMITDVFYTKKNEIGIESNREWNRSTNEIIKWDHFAVTIPDKFVYSGDYTEGEYKNAHRSARGILERALQEISVEAIDTVLELIEADNLYRGKDWKYQLLQLKTLVIEYNAMDISQHHERRRYTWVKEGKVGSGVCHIANHSIGTLLRDISEGKDVEDAVRRYEYIVAPENYKRPKAVFTKKMLDQAKETITKLGYMHSLPRRHATLSDISARDILFIDRDVNNPVATTEDDIFASMEKRTQRTPIKLSGATHEMAMSKFITDILPMAESLEVYVENRLSPNLVSLIAPKYNGAPSMFRWRNNFSWAYAGNMTDSSMLKKNVQEAGGKVDGALRFSIQWNDDPNRHNPNDFDAHCIMSNGKTLNKLRRDVRGDHDHIFFAHKYDPISRGALDVDIRYPAKGKPAVENITWDDVRYMPSGDYRFYVHNYEHRGGRTGFKAEIEFNGQIFSFNYDQELKHLETIEVASVTLDENKRFTLHPKLDCTESQTEVWGLATNSFVPVSTVMYSPNYWLDDPCHFGVGTKHIFFMLKGCKNPENPNGFYNEYLHNDLMVHKRVFEALGEEMKVEYTDQQLSGYGFAMSRKNSVIVKVTSAGVSRVWKLTI